MFPSAVKERWIITRIEARQPDEIRDIVAMIMQLNRLGRLTVDFSQKAISMVEFEERESVLSNLGLDKAPRNGSTVRSG